jgi:hypothetical protein
MVQNQKNPVRTNSFVTLFTSAHFYTLSARRARGRVNDADGRDTLRHLSKGKQIRRSSNATMAAMSRRAGPIETYIRQLVSHYLQTHGHGAAATLGRAIGRPSSWIGTFARGGKRPSVDEGPALVRAARGDAQVFMAAASAADLPPVDPAVTARQAHGLRLFRRLDPRDFERAVQFVELVMRTSQYKKKNVR